MFWHMTGLSAASPVETILDKENYTLEELLDEDDIIQECKALNGRLINFLREKDQVQQLLRYIVEEAPPDAEKRRSFRFPFFACEIFTCEVDVILRTLVEDEELMNLLFSFLEPSSSHSKHLAGYFSKVVLCLLLRKTVPLMSFIQAHPVIIKQLVDLIGITSVMEVLIRLIGGDEHVYTNHPDSMHWIEDTDVLEMIVDKFSSSDSHEVHANAAETLCAITRFAPPGLSSKISSPSFIGRLFCHALEDSRPESVLVNSLSICISLMDPKRLTTGLYHSYNRQLSHGCTVAAQPEIVEGMLGSLGDLLKLLDISSSEKTLPTVYGKLQPPLGKHRLKIVEFIAVLVNVGSQALEKETIRLEVVPRIFGLFFEYPFNNFLHHHIESIIITCLESKNAALIEYILGDCDLIGKILDVEKNSTLPANPDKPTLPAEGRSPPRVGNIGHMTRICNKLVQLTTNSGEIHKFLQENIEWTDWQTNVLAKRNAVENVYQWACGRPTALQDRTRDSDDDDYQERDYDVAVLANNLSQAFHYGIYCQEEIDEPHGSLERDDEDVYFDEESAEVVISSLRLGDDQESGSFFTNSNSFAFDDDRVSMERLASALASSSPDNEGHAATSGDDGEVISREAGLIHSDSPVLSAEAEDSFIQDLLTEVEKPPELFQWEEASTNDEVGPVDAVGKVSSKEAPPTACGEEAAETTEAEPSPVDAEKAEGEHPPLILTSQADDTNWGKVKGESAKEVEATHETGEDKNSSDEAEKGKSKEHVETSD